VVAEPTSTPGVDDDMLIIACSFHLTTECNQRVKGDLSISAEGSLASGVKPVAHREIKLKENKTADSRLFRFS